MKTTRILALILALLMLAVSMAACTVAQVPNTDPEQTPVPEQPNDQTPTPEQPSEDEEPAEKPENVLKLINTGLTDYVIVRDYKASQSIVDAINNVVASIKEDTGAVIEVKQCFIDRPGETTDVVAEKEILIGQTNRPESIEALGGLLADDYTIQVKGSKLVVGGGGDSGTEKALAILLNQHIHEKGNKYEVKAGRLQSISFSEKENVSAKGVYSYSSYKLMDARIDSYYMFFPKGGELEQTYKAFAERVQDHIGLMTGYELDVYKDSRYWADYEILIGNTARTPEELYEDLADDEYVIQLVKTQVTYEDGSLHDGAQLYICFGEDAADAAYSAFVKEMMPASATLLEKNFQELTIRGSVN